MKNPLSFLTDEQTKVVQKELQEEGYVVLQRWKNKGKPDYRVLKDTVIIPKSDTLLPIKVFKKYSTALIISCSFDFPFGLFFILIFI